MTLKAPPVDVPSWLRTAANIGWRLLVLFAVLYVALWLLLKIGVVVFAVLVAAIFTTLFVPPAQWLEERGMSRAVASSVVVVGGIILVFGLGALIVMRFIASAPELGQSLSQAYDQLLQWLSTVGLSPEEVRSSISGMFAGGGEGGGGGAAGSVVSGGRVVFEIIAGFLLMLVLLFFFVKDREEIAGWFRELVPSGYRPVADRLGGRTWDVLARYLRGVAIIATVDAIGTVIGLLIIGVPLVLPLGVLMFLGGFIPVVGATVAGFVAIMVALVSGGLVDAALTLGVVVLVQQVDAHVLQPVVMGREVPLHPAMVLVTVAAGAAAFGIPGAILAVPVAAVASAVGHELRLMNVEEA